MSEALDIPFNAALIEMFGGMFLSPMYDNVAPVPPFHRASWELYCGPSLFAGVAAPRGHAKSTALTHTFILANVLFRVESHVMLVSSSEELGMGQLGDIAKELRDNDELRDEFGISKFLTDSKSEIVVECTDGHQFRILARGVEQRVRGIKWKGRRPGLIVGDDMEEDEQVENIARRKKLSRWVNRAMIPMGRKGCKVRIHGTILHQDSLLARIMKSSQWDTLFFKAHAGFDDFSQILWPEMFDEKLLRQKRQLYIDDNDAAGYSQEYLNDPHDNEDAYLKKDWFLAMSDDDFDSSKLIGAAADFAISKKDAANRTSITIGGVDTKNTLNVIDQRVGRMDSEEIIEEIFSVNEQWHPDFFWVEGGQIWLALWPVIRTAMQKKNRFINFIVRTPIKDKASRGRALQKRMRGGGAKFNKSAYWYLGYEEELLRFTGISEATLDDQFDSTALLALGFEELPEVEEEDFEDEDLAYLRREDPRKTQGRNQVTGY
jgi:hypothetical protein